MLPPVMSKIIDTDPLCWLEFTEDSIITSCKSGKSNFQRSQFGLAGHILMNEGHVRTWDRPRDVGVSKSETTLASS